MESEVMPEKMEVIHVDGISVSYTYYKGGASFLFLFHGFGQTADIYTAFIPQVCSQYSVIAFDLFTSLKNNKTYEPVISIPQWNALIEQLREKYSIEKFSILSFSMGTRFTVSMLELQALRIQRMVLIAPDGFGNTVWFRIATATYLSRKIFKAVMKHPETIKRIAKGMHKAGLLNQITYRFIERNLENKFLTEKIYQTWVYVRKLRMPPEAFISLINRHGIKLLFVLGKQDQLVAAGKIRSIAMQTHAQLLELELAHHKLTQTIDGGEVKRFLISDGK
jgi:pimeloyl-ACP methyl ester carboxylesterase